MKHGGRMEYFVETEGVRRWLNPADPYDRLIIAQAERRPVLMRGRLRKRRLRAKQPEHTHARAIFDPAMWRWRCTCMRLMK